MPERARSSGSAGVSPAIPDRGNAGETPALQKLVHPEEAPLSRTAQLSLVVAAVAIGVAIKVNGGNYHPLAIGLIALALLAGMLAVVNLRVARVERLRGTAFGVVLTAAVAVHWIGLLVPPLTPVSTTPASPVRMYNLLEDCGFAPQPPQSTASAYWLLGACGFAGAIALAASMRRSLTAQRIAAAAMPLALLLHFAGLIASIRACPAPAMDVIVSQSVAVARLLTGDNPYSGTVPDVAGDATLHYAPDLVANAQLLFGFPYPPLSLFWLIPAWYAEGLIQHMHAVAFTVAAALIAYAARSPLAKTAAVLFMLMPVGPMVVCNGWTEPLVVLMLALTVFIACRKPGWSGLGLGLFWAAKQYVPLTAPLAVLLAGKPAGRADLARIAGVAVIVAALVTLPLASRDLPAFWHSVVWVQFRQPFRPDALSFLAAAHHAFDAAPPAWIAFIALAAVQCLALWKAPRNPAGFATATAVSLLAFFAFNKQAFANYYFLVVGALAIALAASSAPAPDKSAPTALSATPSRPSSGRSSRRR